MGFLKLSRIKFLLDYPEEICKAGEEKERKHFFFFSRTPKNLSRETAIDYMQDLQETSHEFSAEIVTIFLGTI